MTAIIDAAALADATKWAARALPGNPPVAALGGMTLEVVDTGAGGALLLGAFDYDLAAHSFAPAAGKEIERILVHGKTFADIASDLTGDVRLTLEERSLRIEAGKRERYRLPLMAIGEYPATPVPDVVDVHVPGFADAVQRVAVAAATDPKADDRMKIVQLTAGGGTLRMAAVTNTRMAVQTLPWDGPDHRINLPAAGLRDLSRALSAKPGIGFGQNLKASRISILDGNQTATLQNSEVEGPDVDKYVKGYSKKVQETPLWVEREALIKAVKKVQRVIPSTFIPVVLDFTEDAIAVSVAGDDSADGEVLVDAAYFGPPRRLGLLPGLLADALLAVPGPVVHLQLPGGPTGGFIFHACSEAGGEPDPSYLHLVMTMQIPGAN